MKGSNYCTLEMASRLVEAGIVLETEAVWHLQGDNETYFLQSQGSSAHLCVRWGDYPAPCMAEVWRELPERRTINTCICEISFTKVGPFHVACYSWFYEAMSPLFKTTNPTDALCELLIWVKGQYNER